MTDQIKMLRVEFFPLSRDELVQFISVPFRIMKRLTRRAGGQIIGGQPDPRSP